MGKKTVKLNQTNVLKRKLRNVMFGVTVSGIIGGSFLEGTQANNYFSKVVIAKKTSKSKTAMITKKTFRYNKKGQKLNKPSLKKGKRIFIYGSKKIKGSGFYSIGNKQYVKANSVKIYKSAAKNARIKYSTYIFDSNGQKVKKINEGIRIKIYETKVIKGKRYYSLGNNKYILASKIVITSKNNKQSAINNSDSDSNSINNSTPIVDVPSYVPAPSTGGSNTHEPGANAPDHTTVPDNSEHIPSSGNSNSSADSGSSIDSGSHEPDINKPTTQNKEVLVDGHWKLQDPKGNYLTGFQTIPNKDNKIVYYDKTGMVYGERKIDGYWYLFDSVTGAMKTGFQKLNNPKRTVYYSSTGKMQYGWQKIGDKKYFFDRFDGGMYQGKHTINGSDYSFSDDGSLQKDLSKERDEYREKVAENVAKLIEHNYNAKIDFDWNNQTDDYQAFTLHDTAQLVASKSLDEDALTIEKSIQNNALMQGRLESCFTDSESQDFSDTTAENIAEKFVNSLSSSSNLDGKVLGVGADTKDGKSNTAILLYDVLGTPTQIGRVSSAIKPVVKDTYKNPGVNVDVDNGIEINQSLTPDDLGNFANLADPFLLSGEKDQKISTKDLKQIFQTLSGREGKLVGRKNYFNGKDVYHYEFWIEGQDKDQKEYNFLEVNKNTKYGDQIIVPYTATLVWGVAPSSDQDKVWPSASEMTDDQIKESYQSGTDTGLSKDQVIIKPIEGMTEDTIRGVDVSSYLSLKNAGVKFYDFDGNEASMFKVLHDAGVNYIRLRLWNDPYNSKGQSYGGGIDDEATVLQIAKEAQQYGIKTLLGFQYSDFWTDPATQALPKAWSHESAPNIEASIYNYTKKVLLDFKKNGIDVGMVQIGNEITKGMTDIIGSKKDVWQTKDNSAQLAGYLNAGSKAVREAYDNALVTLHLETPYPADYEPILNSLKENKVDYDVLGSSYYPLYGWQANNPTNLSSVEKLATEKFGKKFVVLETGWPNSLNDSDGTPNNIGYDPGHYSVSPQGQVDEMAEMYQTILADKNGLGAFYWEPAWIPVRAGWDSWEYNKNVANSHGTGWANGNSQGYYPDYKLYYNGKPSWGGSSWDNNTLFDNQGHPLQSLYMYNGFKSIYKQN